jgi:hypothetical protein
MDEVGYLFLERPDAVCGKVRLRLDVNARREGSDLGSHNWSKIQNRRQHLAKVIIHYCGGTR